MKNNLIVSFIMVLIAISMLVGCSQTNSSGGGGTTTDYSIQGTASLVQSSGIRAKDALPITHIVAIASNNDKYLATLNTTDGTFTVNVAKGFPYVLGFYNKSAGKVTMLGYLVQSEVDWNSLPIMDPTDSSTDLGNVSVDSESKEATATISLDSLLSKMSMTDSTAQYYGSIDDSLTVLSNLDVDGNGEFDFDEGKGYLFQVYINMSPQDTTGNITQMLSGYNSSYKPNPPSYGMVFSAQGDVKPNNVNGTLAFPGTVYVGTTALTEMASPTESAGTGWCIFFKENGNPISSPEVAPAGTYVATVEGTTYTMNNFQGSSVVGVGSQNGIIYPVFHLVTNEAGIITTVQYQWQKLVNGVTEEASAAELQAAIEDTSASTTFVHTSPFISFFSDQNTLIGSIVKFSRDGTSVDVSSLNITPTDIDHIQASYNLTSRVVCKFDLY